MKKRNLSDNELDTILSALSKSARGPLDESASEKNYALLEKQLVKTKTKQLSIFKYAAAASVALIISLSAYFLHISGDPQMLIVSTTDQIKEVTLSDGSVVTLSRYSTLQYPEKFDGKTRNVILTGEGFFDVSKDKSHPFIVEASDVQIKVLGTQFNVQSYTNDNYIKTTLLEGSVAVSNSLNKNTEILKPNESAIFDKKSGELIKESDENASDEISWKSGTLLFNNKPLFEIADDLSNYFNISIRIVDNNLKDHKLTARFNQNESIDEILNLLQSVGNFSWKKDKDTLTIYTNH